MNEIYLQTQPRLTLDFSGDDMPQISSALPVTMEVMDGLSVVYTSDVLEPYSDDVYSCAFPYTLTFSEHQYNVVWNYSIDGVNYLQNIEQVEVVTPYITLAELYKLYPSWAVHELRLLEQRVRYSINNFTGQSFGTEIKTIQVDGNDGLTLTLPQRLTSLTSITAAYNNYEDLSQFGVSQLDDYTLYFDPAALWVDDQWTTQGPIVAPPLGEYSYFRQDVTYIVTGQFGYPSVPADVRAAARILACDYADKADKYRQRNLKSMQSGNWTMGFNWMVNSTGNTDVDNMLLQYTALNLAVI